MNKDGEDRLEQETRRVQKVGGPDAAAATAMRVMWVIHLKSPEPTELPAALGASDAPNDQPACGDPTRSCGAACGLARAPCA